MIIGMMELLLSDLLVGFDSALSSWAGDGGRLRTRTASRLNPGTQE
jgi:hypothetical protein